MEEVHQTHPSFGASPAGDLLLGSDGQGRVIANQMPGSAAGRPGRGVSISGHEVMLGICSSLFPAKPMSRADGEGGTCFSPKGPNCSWRCVSPCLHGARSCPPEAASSCRRPRRSAPASLGRRCPTAGARSASDPGCPRARRLPPRTRMHVRVRHHAPHDTKLSRQLQWDFAYHAETSGTRHSPSLPPQASGALAPLAGVSRAESGAYTDWLWGDSFVASPLLIPRPVRQPSLGLRGESLPSSGRVIGSSPRKDRSPSARDCEFY